MSLLRGSFHFTLWPTLFTIPAMVLLIGLGTWQLQRLQEKTALINFREAALSAPPVDIPAAGDDSASLDFHHVHASGTFDHSHELYIAALNKYGVQGYQIVTPMTLPDGRILLVNRGFVPEARKDPASRADGQVAGTIDVDGILRIPTVPKGFIVPQNQPQVNYWIYVDIPAMAKAADLDPAHMTPFYVEAGSHANPGGLPVGGQTRISLPNDHLQYALTWYSFAVTLLVIYFMYHYRKHEDAP